MAKNFFSSSFIPPEQGSLGELVTDMEVFTRNDDDADDCDDDESSDDDDGESSE